MLGETLSTDVEAVKKHQTKDSAHQTGDWGSRQTSAIGRGVGVGWAHSVASQPTQTTTLSSGWQARVEKLKGCKLAQVGHNAIIHL